MRKLEAIAAISFAVAVLCTASLSHGRTWYVEKNGTADFAIIQDAVDAARSGDVIRIGPGRYTDYTVIEDWGPMGYSNMHVWLDGTKSLTLVGAGGEATVIGPEVYEPGLTDIGIACASGAIDVSIAGIKIENQNYRAATFYCESIRIADCVVKKCHGGLRLDDVIESVAIENCRILDGIVTSVNYAISCAAPVAVLRNVEIESWLAGINLDCPGSTDILVSDCRIVGGGVGLVGMQFTFRGGGTVENCYFSDFQNYAFVAGDAGTVVFRNNTIENCPGTGIGFEGCEDFTVYGNIVRDCVPCIFIGEPCGVQSVYDNIFLRNEDVAGRYIRTTGYFPFGPHYMDFSNNWWGTTDLNEISEWIYDGHDDPDVWLYVVFDPIADSPLDVAPDARGVSLLPPYPNPFNPETTIRFRLEDSSEIDFAIYNVRGVRVTTLASGEYAAGMHQTVWRGKDRYGLNAPSGVYFARLVAGGAVATERLALVK